MIETELETAIRAHEMQRLELKESFGAECIETACAFANAQGGRIVLGVDNNGEIARSPLRFEALRDYENRIATATEPSVAIDAFYDMHLIEHYGSGIRRIKDECAKNGNKPPAWSQKYGSFITVYKSRLENDPTSQDSGTANEVANAPREVVNEVVNGADATVNPQNDTMNEGRGTINAPSGTINAPSGTTNPLDDTTKQRLLDTIRQKEGLKREALAELHSVSLRTVARLLADLEHEGKIVYRGSKKTGGYYAVTKGKA